MRWLVVLTICSMVSVTRGARADGTYFTEGFGGTTEVIAEQTYDALGRTAQRTLPHTTAATSIPSNQYSYDHLNRITGINHSDGSSNAGRW